MKLPEIKTQVLAKLTQDQVRNYGSLKLKSTWESALDSITPIIYQIETPLPELEFELNYIEASHTPPDESGTPTESEDDDLPYEPIEYSVETPTDTTNLMLLPIVLLLLILDGFRPLFSQLREFTVTKLQTVISAINPTFNKFYYAL